MPCTCFVLSRQQIAPRRRGGHQLGGTRTSPPSVRCSAGWCSAWPAARGTRPRPSRWLVLLLLANTWGEVRGSSTKLSGGGGKLSGGGGKLSGGGGVAEERAASAVARKKALPVPRRGSGRKGRCSARRASFKASRALGRQPDRARSPETVDLLAAFTEAEPVRAARLCDKESACKPHLPCEPRSVAICCRDNTMAH